MIFFLFEKADAYIFTKLLALNRATFKEHLVILSYKNIYVYNKVTTHTEEAFLKIWFCGEHFHSETGYLKPKRKRFR